MSLLPLAGGRESPIGSRIVITPPGGVFMGTSLWTFTGWSPTFYFFLGRLAAREGEHSPRLELGEGCALGMNQSTVIFFLVTMASS